MLLGDDKESQKYLSDETKRKTDEAIWSQAADIVVGALNGEIFHDIVEQVKVSRGHEIKTDAKNATKKITKEYSLSDGEETSVLEHLIAGKEYNQYGMANAVTATAGQSKNYDRATELEKLGGTIIDLSPTQWSVLA